MACYRLIFKNRQVFEVDVDRVDPLDDRSTFCTALFYRVVNGVREPEPMHRVDGGPIVIHAVNDHAAVKIACDVLATVSGSWLVRLGSCSTELPIRRTSTA